MARNFVSASAQYLTRASGVITGYPFTVVVHARRSVDARASCLVSSGASSSNFFSLEFNTDGRTRFRCRGGGGGEVSAFSSSGSGVALDTWASLSAVGVSDAERLTYVDGTSAGGNLTSSIPSSYTDTYIGRQVGTTSRDHDGDIARVTFWDVALSQPELAALAQVLDPWLFRPANIVSDTLLTGRYSQEIDVAGGGAWTHMGSPAYADNPRMFRQPRTKTMFTHATPPPPVPIAAIAAYYQRLRSA